MQRVVLILLVVGHAKHVAVDAKDRCGVRCTRVRKQGGGGRRSSRSSRRGGRGGERWSHGWPCDPCQGARNRARVGGSEVRGVRRVWRGCVGCRVRGTRRNDHRLQRPPHTHASRRRHNASHGDTTRSVRRWQQRQCGVCSTNTYNRQRWETQHGKGRARRQKVKQALTSQRKEPGEATQTLARIAFREILELMNAVGRSSVRWPQKGHARPDSSRRARA
jgi:hypothetical protein